MKNLRAGMVMIALALGLAAGAGAASGRGDFSKVPGVVIDHSPVSSGIYIGSPSIAVLPNGDYVASHDEFGPKTVEHKQAISHVFRSSDRGQTWKKIATVEGQFWSTLFVHRGALYFIGTDRHHGNAIIRRSTDGGVTWTSPTNATTGLLRDNGEYHCAPMPVLEHAGRLWRGMEWRNPPVAWGINYRAGMLSVPVDADLLDARQWTFSNFVPSDRAWNGGDMGAWLEGNAVVTPEGELVDMLRVQTQSPHEKAAIVKISADGRTAAFDPNTGFVNFPGGAKKFTIRFDPETKLYWSLASIIPDRHWGQNPGGIRNTLALTCSSNLVNWAIRCVLLYHPDVARHGFQYVDWLFEDRDIIASCRTAYDDGLGGAHNAHDANFLTFHRVKDFRNKTMADSVPMPALPEKVFEVGELTIRGRGFEMGVLTNGAKAFSNRNYVWREVPAKFEGWQWTRTGGGERAQMRVKAKSDTVVHIATAVPQFESRLGWERIWESFIYTDARRTGVQVFRRSVRAGEEIDISQENWTGGMVLVEGR